MSQELIQTEKTPTVIPLDLEQVGYYLSEEGPFAASSENYEERPVQIELLKNIAKAFNNNAIGVFEAGTGVGKSFAYLIPAMVWAIKNNEKVVISTGTINLQQQLVEKDIPVAEKIIGKKIKYILLKGRQNYVCKRRFDVFAAQKELFDSDSELIDLLCKWVSSSETGSRSELTFFPPENLWSKINSESDACMGNHCPFFSDCFVMKIRKKAATADLLVVNHHLLFADIEARLQGGGYEDAAVLPPYKRIIFDEAHGIESAATSFFSESFNRFKVLKLLNQLYRKKKNSESGFLCTLAIISSMEESSVSLYEMVSRIKNDIANLETAALDMFQNDYTVRLYEKNAVSFGAVISLASTLDASIGKLVFYSKELLKSVDEEDKEIPAYWETKVLISRLECISAVLRDFSVWQEKPDSVFWMQKKVLPKDSSFENSNPFFVNMTETPLDIAPMMYSGVFEPMNTVVCTSATLKTGRSFSYWMNRTGITFVDSERILQGQFDSPFPYSKNMIFAVPSDAPLPDDMNFQLWIVNALTKLILAADGRTLVLFTSYESLQNAYNSVLRNLKGFSGAILKQGSDDNARLLENFKKDETSVLFATDSFWQGVDVPGNSLSQVVIVKLPFAVPSDPVFTARSEAILKHGGNSFMELSVPDAVIKFRQGIGRLIRKSSDRGAVVVLDRRIYEKRYGSIFMSNVPECKKMYEPLDSICKAVSNFIFN